MAEVQLSIQTRKANTKGETHGLRKQGKIPGVVYGKTIAPEPIYVDRKEFVHAITQPAGLNVILSLQLEGGKPIFALVREMQRDVLSREIIHIDLHAISLEETITAYIPLRLQGTPVGLQEGGVLQQNLHQIEVECLPTAIPQHIDLEVSSMVIGDSMFVRDLVLPVGVELVTEGETAVVTLVPPEKVEVPVEVAPVEGEMAEPEKAVEGEGKEGKPA